ncbi:hypothetical protein N9Z82_02105 [Akkermansiaceae bacterium]|nr:hypothetical protein [Akkermansiaceae bacterium]
MFRSFSKKLKPNDLGLTGSHQGGICIPKQDEEALMVLPKLNQDEINPEQSITCYDRKGHLWEFRFIYYNGKNHGISSRDEYRLTGMTKFFKKWSPSVGDSLVFQKTTTEYLYTLEIKKAPKDNSHPREIENKIDLSKPSTEVKTNPANSNELNNTLTRENTLIKQNCEDEETFNASDNGPRIEETSLESQPISVLSLGAYANLLYKHGFKTVGNLVEWKSNGYRPKIDGVGAGKIQRIDQALNKLQIRFSLPSTPDNTLPSAPRFIAHFLDLPRALHRKLFVLKLTTIDDVLQWADSGFNPKVRGINRKSEQLILDALGAQLGDILRINLLDSPISDLSASHLAFISSSIEHLKKANLETIGEVYQWALNGFEPKLKGVGVTKYALIISSLRQLEERNEKSISSVGQDSTVSKGDLLEKSRDANGSVKVENLHLGNRGHHLEKAGYHDLKSLADYYSQGCPQLPAFGRTSATHARFILEAIFASIEENGNINWSSFCERAKIPMLPSSYSSEAGSFLETIPQITDEIIELTGDDLEKEVLEERLTKYRVDQLTLEEIATKYGVTRERVRQKQRNLINRISSGLLDNEYETADFRFNSEYCKFWIEAEKALEELPYVTNDNLLTALSSIWNVPKRGLVKHLPFIFSVLTQEGSAPSTFSISSKYPVLSDLENLPDSISGMPLRELKLAESSGINTARTNRLKKESITTVGELLRGLSNPKSFFFIEKCPAYALNSLSKIEKSIIEQGGIESFSWEFFYEKEGYLVLPLEEVYSPAQFFDKLRSTISLSVESCEKSGHFYKHSYEILLKRTLSKNSERMTLFELGKAVGVAGPTVSKIEKELGIRLNKQLLERKFLGSYIIFRKSFTDYWKLLSEFYEQHKSLNTFREKIATEWDLSPNIIEENLNLIWIILTTHPTRSRSHWKYGRLKKEANKPVELELLVPRIVLRKKRTVH